MHDQVFRLRREIRASETSPEALARFSARAARLTANGREPGWSLMLNPTPALVEDLGFETADDVRHMMIERRWAAQHGAVTTVTNLADSSVETSEPHAGWSEDGLAGSLTAEPDPNERSIGYFLQAAEPVGHQNPDALSVPPFIAGAGNNPEVLRERDAGMEGPM